MRAIVQGFASTLRLQSNFNRFCSEKDVSNQSPDMSGFQKILDNNKKWAAHNVEKEPDFFSKLVNIQAPKYLWIGCSDSRVPAN